MLEVVVVCITLIIGGAIIVSMLKALAMNDSDFEKKRKELLKLFNSAKSTIHITTDLDIRFFEKEEIIESLKNAAERGVEVKILSDPKGYKIAEMPKLEELVNKGLINVTEAKEPFKIRKLHHYMIIDKRAARLETYHPPKGFGNGKSKGVIYNVPRVALYAEHEFNEQWEQRLG